MDDLKEMLKFSRYIVDLLERAESAEALLARVNELAAMEARLDVDIPQKQELEKERDSIKAEIAALEQRHGELKQVGDLAKKIREQSAILKQINGEIESMRQKIAAA